MVSEPEWQQKVAVRSLIAEGQKVEPDYPLDPPALLPHQDVNTAAGLASGKIPHAFKTFQERSMPSQGFTKASRLLDSSQFSPVFSQAQFRISGKNLLILARSSGEPARVGLVIGKKQVKTAVQRNRIKRLIRESFRIRKQEFGTIDLVLLARPGLDSLNNQEITAQINKLFDELLKKLK